MASFCLWKHILCLHVAATSSNELQTPSSPLLCRSLSAPPKLDRSMSVQEGIHDVRRLQRWRTNVQKKHSRVSPEDQIDSDVNKTFVSTVAEIFSFIGSDPDKAVSWCSITHKCTCRCLLCTKTARKMWFFNRPNLWHWVAMHKVTFVWLSAS